MSSHKFSTVHLHKANHEDSDTHADMFIRYEHEEHAIQNHILLHCCSNLMSRIIIFRDTKLVSLWCSVNIAY